MSMPLPTADINFVYTRHTADFGLQRLVLYLSACDIYQLAEL